jgi:hypothetical protein
MLCLITTINPTKSKKKLIKRRKNATAMKPDKPHCNENWSIITTL